MEITISVNTQNAKDVRLMGMLASFINVYNEKVNPEENEDEDKEEAKDDSNDSEVKPIPVRRRARRKKAEPVEDAPAEEEPVTDENPAEDTPVEEPAAEEQGDMPFDEETKEETKEETSVPVMNEDEWKAVLFKKRSELKLDSDNADKKKDFNAYVMKLAKEYGADKPKLLTPENLYKFVTEKFNMISIDENGKFCLMPF